MLGNIKDQQNPSKTIKSINKIILKLLVFIQFGRHCGKSANLGTSLIFRTGFSMFRHLIIRSSNQTTKPNWTNTSIRDDFSTSTFFCQRHNKRIYHPTYSLLPSLPFEGGKCSHNFAISQFRNSRSGSSHKHISSQFLSEVPQWFMRCLF